MSEYALIIVDAQNEFSPAGKRAVANHQTAIAAIRRWLTRAREGGWGVAWVQHHNRPNESRAFVPGTPGADFSPELGRRWENGDEQLFQKDVFGAFTGTNLEAWLRQRGVSHVVIVGFYAHMCVSTSVREALVRGFEVLIDPEATGAADLQHPQLGAQSADDVRRSAFLHLAHLGAHIGATVESVWPASAIAAAP
jgi:nicotinamidase-related amidase